MKKFYYNFLVILFILFSCNILYSQPKYKIIISGPCEYKAMVPRKGFISSEEIKDSRFFEASKLNQGIDIINDNSEVIITFTIQNKIKTLGYSVEIGGPVQKNLGLVKPGENCRYQIRYRIGDLKRYTSIYFTLDASTTEAKLYNAGNQLSYGLLGVSMPTQYDVDVILRFFSSSPVILQHISKLVIEREKDIRKLSGGSDIISIVPRLIILADSLTNPEKADISDIKNFIEVISFFAKYFPKDIKFILINAGMRSDDASRLIGKLSTTGKVMGVVDMGLAALRTGEQWWNLFTAPVIQFITYDVSVIKKDKRNNLLKF